MQSRQCFRQPLVISCEAAIAEPTFGFCRARERLAADWLDFFCCAKEPPPGWLQSHTIRTNKFGCWLESVRSDTTRRKTKNKSRGSPGSCLYDVTPVTLLNTNSDLTFADALFYVIFPNTMKYRVPFVFLVLMLCSVSVWSQKSYPKYLGKPETDSKFVNFIKRNSGRVVYLSLSIANGDFVVNGYRGVQPSFDGKKTGGIDYSFFLECESGSNLTPIEECKGAAWKGGSGESGTLSGYFKVSRIIRTSRRNYRAVFLIPVKV